MRPRGRNFNGIEHHCRRCGVTKPAAEFYTWYDKEAGKLRLHMWYCRECSRRIRRIRYWWVEVLRGKRASRWLK